MKDVLKELSLMQQVYGTFFSVTNKIQSAGDSYLGKLTSRQFMAIVSILHLAPNECSIINIAKKLGTSKQNAQKLVSSLAKMGYVDIIQDDRDRRYVNVSLTDSGKQATVECGEHMVCFMADLFREFSQKELELLWSLLMKMFRFDGVEFDGFEKEATDVILVENQELVQRKYMEEFATRRNKRKKEDL